LNRVLLALALLTCGFALAETPVVELPKDPPATRTVDLQELWRLGGEDDEDVLLGVVARGVMDADGNTYLLDRQLSQVLVIGLDGQLVTTLGREGDGPGEMRRPMDLFLLEDGQVAVSQGFPGKIIILNPDDTPGGSISVGESSETGGFHFVGQAVMRAGNLVVRSGRGTFDQESSKSTTVQSLALVDRQGKQLVSFVENTQVRDFTRQEFNEAKNFSELDTWALGDDALFTAPVRDEYLIHKHGMDGEVQVAIRREFATRTRNQEDKDELTENMRIIINGVRQEIEKHILDNDPALMSLNVAADGRLFAVNCHGQRKVLPDGVMGRYDVISPDGEFLEELSLAIPGVNHEQDRLLFLDGRYWLLIRNFDSASASMNAGFGGGDEDEDALGEIEPLEVVLYVMPD
jgi:hypothetical protein